VSLIGLIKYFCLFLYFIVFKHEVCTLKEIIESEREKYKKTVRVSYPASVQRDTKSWNTGKFFKQEKVWTKKSAYLVRTKMTFLINP
jgi:hypothetical protein